MPRRCAHEQVDSVSTAMNSPLAGTYRRGRKAIWLDLTTFVQIPHIRHLVQGLSQATLYKLVLEKVVIQREAGVEDAEIDSSISTDLISLLSQPSDGVDEGSRLQFMRRQIARDWGEVFCRLDNLGHLTGWLINDCQRDGDERHLVLCLFAFEAIRNLFAIVSQLRSALSQDTIGYLRTLYETFLRSRFILKFSDVDADLPGRYLYYTNSKYLALYRMFAPEDDPHVADNMWVEYEKKYAGRYSTMGKGDYGWAYPHIKKQNGSPSRRPGFGQLMKTVDQGSIYSGMYYEVFASKSHGEFIWNPLMVRPEGRGTYIDSFSVGGIGLILDLTMPLVREILENTTGSCGNTDHRAVMGVVTALVSRINDSIAEIKSSDPEMHGSLQS